LRPYPSTPGSQVAIEGNTKTTASSASIPCN